MYIQRIKRKNKSGNTSTSIILAENYRADGTIKRKIIATLTKMPDYIIAAIENSLKK